MPTIAWNSKRLCGSAQMNVSPSDGGRVFCCIVSLDLFSGSYLRDWFYQKVNCDVHFDYTITFELIKWARDARSIFNQDSIVLNAIIYDDDDDGKNVACSGGGAWITVRLHGNHDARAYPWTHKSYAAKMGARNLLIVLVADGHCVASTNFGAYRLLRWVVHFYEVLFSF